MLPLLLAPLLTTLAQNGLQMLAGAIQAKGKEVIEAKLGVKIPTAVEDLTPAVLRELKIREMEHEEFLISAQIEKSKLELAAEEAASKEVTSRWQADMASDNQLSKNVRPGIIIYLTAAITLFALMSIWELSIAEVYVTLLGQLTLLVYGAYFVGRSVEKVVDMKRGEK